MDKSAHIRYNAEDRSYLAILKKEIHLSCINAGFSKKKIAEIDIIVAEMASNLVKHAVGGEILVKIFGEKESAEIELIAIDSGPGITSLKKMLQDGASTTQTLGHGLGAMQRLAQTFQIYSLSEWGTIVLCRVDNSTGTVSPRKSRMEVRWISVAKPGEEYCGDGAYVQVGPHSVDIFVGDGLGHGKEAHAAAQSAIDVARATPVWSSPVDIIREMHLAVKKTRGLVGVAATYSSRDKQWRFCGVGNISTRVYAAMTYKNHISFNGIIGLNVPTSLKEQVVAAERGQTVILCSDGIKTRWDVQKYTGIFKYDLTILAAAIYKDFSRKTDDTSVLAARINSVS